ncbi:MAG: hypothetical protein AB7N76_19500 [Planctomycetota bacterium]
MSKKILALASGTLLVGAAHLLLEGPAARDVAEKTTALFVAYLVGQGVADHGKEAAKVASSQGRTS